LSVGAVLTLSVAWSWITRANDGVEVINNQATAESTSVAFKGVEPYTVEDLDPDFEQMQAAEEKREKDAIDVALKDPKVKKYRKGAEGLDTYWRPVKKAGKVFDEVTLRWVEKRTVTGDWQTFQVRSYTGIYDITVLLKKGKVMSVDVTELPDKTVTQTFTEWEKGVISIAMQDARVQELLKGRKAFVNGIHVGASLFDPAFNCPIEECVVVGILKEESADDALAVWINPIAGHVAKTGYSEGW
jgi:hypothetical protein